MRIQFQGIDPTSNGGPAKFARRLEKAISQKGHTVIFEDGIFDIALLFIKNFYAIREDKKYVQRIDGIYLNTQPNFEGLTHENGNKLIERAYNDVDAHVFQSNFSKDIVSKHFGKREVPSDIIYNGMEIPQNLAKKKLPLLEKYEKVILSVASWRPNKMPVDNIRIFQELKKIVDYPVGMAMIGEHYGGGAGSLPRDPDLLMIDQSISDEVLKTFYQSADYFFHTSYLDWCPNAVVEALAHSIPVLVTEGSGAKELLLGTGTCGMREWSDGLQNTYHPPSIDAKAIAQQIAEDLEKEHDFTEVHKLIDIDNVADRYLQFFEEVL